MHEPMTPAICVSTLAVAKCAMVATWHAAGELNWMRYGLPFWGFLMDRIDHRIAVSDSAAASAKRWLPHLDFEVIPNGVLIPPAADPANRENSIVFIGRHDKRKGMPVLLKAWPDIHRRTGARLRLVGADPLAVRARARAAPDPARRDRHPRLPPAGGADRASSCARRRSPCPSVGQESFGMVLTRGFACAVPVVASATFRGTGR